MESICEHGINWRNGEIYNWSMAVEPKTFGERVAWLRRYVRVFVRDNQVTEVRFNFW